jgi:hypothetical protein
VPFIKHDSSNYETKMTTYETKMKTCEYCGAVNSRSWRKVECLDGNHAGQEVWCCATCWNLSLRDIPDEVLYMIGEDSDDDDDSD